MKVKNAVLYSYRMKVDAGFAPNPFHGILTLAICKPGIRRNAAIRRELDAGNDVWIAGWSSHYISPAPECTRQLIWLGKVSKQISLAEYWENKEYEAKKAVVGDAEQNVSGCSCHGVAPVRDIADCSGCCDSNGTEETTHPISYYGDNIYSPDPHSELGYKQKPNNFHGEGDVKRDVSGKNVLICNEYYYFGHRELMLNVPIELLPAIPPSQTCYGSKTLNERASQFIEYCETQPCLISHLNPMPKK